jgi:hypothetical protein
MAALILATSSVLRLAAVIRDAGVEFRRRHRHVVDRAAAPAEADRADLAVAGFMGAEEGDRRHAVGGRLAGRQLPEHLARLVLVGRRAAERRQEVGRQRDEAFQRQAPGDVADVGVEAAVLVHDDDGRQLGGRPGGLRQIALHLARTARIGDVLGCHALVVLGDHRRLRRVRRQQRRDRCGRRAGAGELRQLLHEAAPVQRQVGVFVVGVDHRLRDRGTRHGFPPSWPLALPR